jgi:hypothetical protein
VVCTTSQLVLGSDLAYSPAAIAPLQAVLRRLFDAGGDAPPTLLLAHKRRHAPVDAALLGMLAAEHLEVETIPHACQHPDFRSPGIELYRVTSVPQLLPSEPLPPLKR